MTTGTTPSAPHDPYAALRVPSYRRYLFGWGCAVVGAQMKAAAIGWQVYAWTKDPMALGWVGLCGAAPMLLLSLPAGHVADIIDRRKLLIASMAAASLCSVAIAALAHFHGPLPLLYLLLTIDSAALTFARPTRAALLPQIVPPEHFNNAVTWNSSVFETGTMLGPALGGMIISYSIPAAYLMDALGQMALIAMLLRMQMRPVTRDSNLPRHHLARSLLEGVRFVFSTKILLATLSLDMFAVLLGGATYLLPIFAERLGVGAVGFGWLRAAPAIGAVSTALVTAHLPPARHAGRRMLWAVAGFGVATIVFGLSNSYWLSLAMLLLTGAFDNISVVTRHTLVQVLTPDAMRGRVSAVNGIFIGSSNELGGLESGLTAKLFGPVISVVGGGIGTILVVIATALTSPQLRGFGSLRDARPDEPDREPE